MENFALYIILGLVACSNFACAGDVEKDCLSESVVLKTAWNNAIEGWKEHIPSCAVEIWEILSKADYSCTDECKSNMKSCHESFKADDFQGSMQKYSEAFLSCYTGCYEVYVELYEKMNKKEFKECWEKSGAALLKFKEEKWDEMKKTVETLSFSEKCFTGVRDHVIGECNSYLRNNGMCN